jgi:DNA-binding Lrp family transcriptional regulator
MVSFAMLYHADDYRSLPKMKTGEEGHVMTTTAFVLIEGASDQTAKIVKALQKVKGVKSAHAVTGPYDVIACVEASDIGAVGAVVLSRIRTLKGVTRTVTCVAV